MNSIAKRAARGFIPICAKYLCTSSAPWGNYSHVLIFELLQTLKTKAQQTNTMTVSKSGKRFTV